MSLRQQMAAASEVPGGRVLERANELAVENVGLKAAIDEVNGKREALQQRLASLEQKNADRDSRDDSAVLKQELVNVQKALDNSLKEKEQEYNKLKASYDDIFYEKQKIVDSMAKKDKELKEVQVRMEKMVDSNENSLTSESRDIQEILKSEVQILTKEVAGLKKTLGDKEAVLVTQDEEVRGLRQVVKERTAEVAELARGEQESKAALQQAQLKANTAGEQVEQLQQAAEAGRREEVRLQRSVREGEERLTELGEKFSAERAEKERLKAEGSHTAGLLAQAENHKAEQARQIVVIEASLQKKENDNERFAREKEELMAKIEAGEGVNEAIQQLTKENSILLERLQENTEVLQAKESEHNIKVKLLNSETAALQTLIEKIQGENETLGETVEENLKQIRKLEVCNAELLERQAELSGEVERRAAQTAQLERKTEQRILAADKDLKEKENLFEKLKTKCDKAEQDLLANEDMTKALDNQTKTLQKEKDDLSASNFSLQENILKDKNLIEKLQTSLNCATDQEVEMEVKLRTLEEKTVLDAENMRLLKQAKTVLQEEKLCLETLLEGKDKDCSNLTTKLSHREGRITEVEAGLQETEKKVYEMQKAIEEAVGKERNLLSSIEEKDKTIFAIEEEKSNIVISFESQATILDRLTGEKDTAEKEARRTKLELQAAEQKVCGLQSQLEREKGELSEELGELRAARELLLAQVVDLKNEVERVGVELCGERERSQATAAALNIKLQDAKQTGEKMLDNLERELAGAREGEQRARQSLAALESRLLASTADMARLAGEVEQRRGEGEAAAQARDIAISKQVRGPAMTHNAITLAVGAGGSGRRGWGGAARTFGALRGGRGGDGPDPGGHVGAQAPTGGRPGSAARARQGEPINTGGQRMQDIYNT